MCRIIVPTPHKTEKRRNGRLRHHPKEIVETPVLQVIPCSNSSCHEWSECPYVHKGEKEARRDPATFLYTGVLCPYVKKNKACPRGDDCPFSHTVFELWLHPTRFRTLFCDDGDKCTRKVRAQPPILPTSNMGKGPEALARHVLFCFFAHSPKELREPELAQLESPSERLKGTPQHVSSNMQGAADAPNSDQAPTALIECLVEILKAEPDEIKKKLENAQGDGMPAQDATVPEIAGKPGLGPLQSGMHAPNVCTCGCGGKSGKRQREPMDLGNDVSLTQLQLAAYLAGYQYACGLCDGAIHPVPAPQPQPQLLSSSGAFAEHSRDACNGGTLPESSRMDVSWVGNAERCCTPVPALLNSFDFSSLPHHPPLPDAFAPVAYSTPTQPPNMPLSTAWDEPMFLGASGVGPQPAAPCPLNAHCNDAANHFQQLASSLDWAPASR
ncbi:probable zinc finger CCCH domain-containing protein 2 at N-terminal half [Coccomyxa sp. Obi]|nr:probable zinc finger CCCH domain-containing protein 2 at N-terminal half [Coccomyxa sp. Obi]